jgi:glucan-binding YG repeat protein
MKTTRFLIALIALVMASTVDADAQFLNRLGRAVERSAERAVTRQAERRTEQAVDKTIDGVVDGNEENKAERQQKRDERNREREEQEAAEEQDSAEEQSDSKSSAEEQEAEYVPDEDMQVADTPYTPSESEWAFFAMKEGLVQTFAVKDDKGKVTSQTRNTITAITVPLPFFNGH